MSLYSYRPTPLEYAYTSYLLTTYFAIPIPPNNSNNSHNNNTDNDEIRLPGKILVPFLTSAANIERSLLRLLWSTVDPENIGTLTSRTQFYVLLRLVAMEQAHFIPPLDNDDNNNNNNVNNNDDVNVNDDEKKMNVLKRTLEQTCKLVIALPTFDADTDCPSVAYLMGTYPPPIQQQQQQHAEVITTSAAVAQQQMSVSDAFGSMGDVEDAPLPSLETFTPPVKEEMFEDDDTAAAAVDTADLAHPLSSLAAVVVDEEEDDGFGNFDSVEEQPIIMKIDNNI